MLRKISGKLKNVPKDPQENLEPPKESANSRKISGKLKNDTKPKNPQENLEPPKESGNSRKAKFNPEFTFEKFLREREFLGGLEELMKRNGKMISEDDEEFLIKLDVLKSSIR